MAALDGKTIVVTGASSGMGKAIVNRFVNEGANVLAVARRKERLEELAESLKDAPGSITIFPGDVTENSVCEAMIDEAVKVYGRLDGLANVAGVMDDMSPIGEITDERY
jgi:NADP-dependent 3-hydroxy acid dehydrogenase YdfG